MIWPRKKSSSHSKLHLRGFKHKPVSRNRVKTSRRCYKCSSNEKQLRCCLSKQCMCAIQAQQVPFALSIEKWRVHRISRTTYTQTQRDHSRWWKLISGIIHGQARHASTPMQSQVRRKFRIAKCWVCVDTQPRINVLRHSVEAMEINAKTICPILFGHKNNGTCPGTQRVGQFLAHVLDHLRYES